MPEPSPLRPVNLHLLHSWGGGLDRWARLFAAGDRRSRNLVLASAGTRDAYGLELVLWDAATGEELARRTLHDAICEVAVRNPEYDAVLRALAAEHGAEHLYISSLIGHSLDALALGLPTTIVHHDFFPFCPALNLYFDGTCATCGTEHLDRCRTENPFSELFRGNSTAYWLLLRDRYFELLEGQGPTHVCPLEWVRDALRRIDPRFGARPFAVIGHGLDEAPRDCFGGAEPGRRLRLLHLGRLNRYKGLGSLRALLPRLLPIADVILLGSGPPGAEFAGLDGVRVIEEYQPEELTGWLRRLGPDLALFLSEVPETYSFTLSEVLLRAIPVVARRLGALAARVEPDRDGLLFDTVDECVERVTSLDRSRSALREMSRQLLSLRPRTAEEMVDDYYRLRRARRPGEAA
jgi:glycosyltransferase involved in cell wall biosynthesis